MNQSTHDDCNDTALQAFKFNSIKRLNDAGLLTPRLMRIIEQGTSVAQIQKQLPSTTTIKKKKKIARFKKATGGSAGHVATKKSIHAISTPIGGSPKNRK